MRNRHGAAYHGQQNIKDETEIVHDRHHDVGIFIGLGGVVTQTFIFHVKGELGFFFVAKHFDDLLAADHLFDIAVQIAEGFLLFSKVGAAFAGDAADDLLHGEDGEEDKNGQPSAQIEHGAKNGDDGNQGRKYLRDTDGDHLPQRIGIVGIAAHQIAVGVRIVILDGQGLHVRKHAVADGFEDPLGNDDHGAVIK